MAGIRSTRRQSNKVASSLFGQRSGLGRHEDTRGRSDWPASGQPERWQAWCTATAAFLTGICASEEAWLLLERRYLDGHPSLFPDAIAGWERLREGAERLASLGGALPPLSVAHRGAPRSAEIEPGDVDLDAVRSAARTQAPAVAAQLVDEARAATLEVVGDDEGATGMMARRLRAGG